MKRIALVIVTFNRCHLLSEMIDSVLKMTLTPEKIFVIDNNSQDDTKKIVDGFVSKNETLF
ncbi:glycosyltransferase [Erwinia aphidicola]|nr:glycosyltransferase [Erwinia aphidicola]